MLNASSFNLRLMGRGKFCEELVRKLPDMKLAVAGRNRNTDISEIA